jgi:hypothetical protein
MGLVIYGAIFWVIGKIAKIKLLETVGYYMIIAGGILFILGMVGLNIPLPISAI